MRCSYSRILALNSLALVFAVVLAGCGGGDDPGQLRPVEISQAMQCAMTLGAPTGIRAIPANCGVTQIDGNSHETDQSVIHLYGRSFGSASSGCPPPEFFGPPCFPRFPSSHTVSWNNLTNGTSGAGSSGYGVLGLLNSDWIVFSRSPSDDVAGWSTYSTFTDPAGIALDMGPNTIRVSVSESGRSRAAEITVTRVIDVTPPTVHSVDPIDGGRYVFRVVVFFTEQLDPASVATALQVIDGTGQVAPGTSLYDPLRLTLEWRANPALNGGAACTARLSGVADVAGNTMIDTFEWSFTKI